MYNISKNFKPYNKNFKYLITDSEMVKFINNAYNLRNTS